MQHRVHNTHSSYSISHKYTTSSSSIYFSSAYIYRTSKVPKKNLWKKKKTEKMYSNITKNEENYKYTRNSSNNKMYIYRERERKKTNDFWSEIFL